MLQKIKLTDKKYFADWWRDKELLKLTSGILKRISDKEVDKYFQSILESENSHHFMIVLDKKTIGHITLAKRRNNWHETQIVIGEKNIGAKATVRKRLNFLREKRNVLRFLKFI